MDGLPGSNQAKEELQYDTLEEYICATDRDSDSEVRKNINYWGWMQTQLKGIKVPKKTNKSEVGLRAFSMGLKILRQGNRSDIQSLNEFFVEYTGFIGNNPDDIKAFERYSEISKHEMGVDGDYGELSESSTFPFRESEASEMNNTFIDDLMMDESIFRYVMAAGLTKSETVDEITSRRVESITEEIKGLVSELREEFEMDAVSFITDNFPKWAREGISDEKLEEIKDIVSMMETEHKERAEYVVESLEESNGGN